MLVNGRFPRFAAATAILAPILLTATLGWVGPKGRGLFFSNLLQFVVVLLAAVCSAWVARRGSGFARQMWVLLAMALGLEAIGQAVTTYYQTFAPGALASAVPSDVFFFVWAAPIFMIFLPRSDEDSVELDWLRILDFAQVGIVALTMYLYFFYSPSRWHAEPFGVIREILLVYIARDAMLAVGFHLRSRACAATWFCGLCRWLVVVFVTVACADTISLYTFGTGQATWGDLFFMAPYVMLVLVAVTWEAPEDGTVAFTTTRVGTFFAQQFLPIALPLLVILMAQAIARERFLLGWTAVIVSVLCSAVRLILTNRKTREVAEHLLNTEKALRTSEEMLATAYHASPDAFSINICPNGPYIEVNDGFTRLTGYTREETLGKTPREMSLWVDMEERDRMVENLEKNSSVKDWEFRFRSKNGKTHVGQMSASVLELRGQTCSLVVVRDITERKEAEEILRTSEERLRSLVQNLHVGIVIYSADGRVAFANQAVLDLVGMPLERIKGKSSVEVGFIALNEDGSLMAAERRPVATVISTGKPVRNLLTGWRSPATNELIWLLLDAVPEFSAVGELLRIVVSFTDVTEQRRASEALRESEERFRTLVTELHVGVALHQPDGRVEYVNPALVRLLRIPDVSSITGKTMAELGLKTLAEDGRELTDEERPVSVVIRTRTAVRDVLVGLRRQPSEAPIWIFGSSVPHLDASGNLVRVISSFMDMTEYRRASAALRESEGRFRTLVDDLHVAVVLHRPDGQIEFANPAAYRMFGVPQGAATGKRPSDFGVEMFEENGRPPEENPVYKVFRTGEAIPNGLLALRHYGSDKALWIFGNAVPQFDAHGKVIRVITTFSDVSQMKNAEQEIHQLSTRLMRLQDEERRHIGRELHDGLAQTVLAINLSLAQARQSLEPGEKGATRALEKARELTQQLSREIRTLSYLLHPPLLDELGLVSAVREYAYGFSERSAIETEVKVEPEFPRLSAEVELALFRIVQECLTNIQRHSGSETASILLRREGSQVLLEIADQGRGAEGWSKAENGNARLGVGIAGMRERISQLGGKLEILSGAQGTTVRAMVAVREGGSVDVREMKEIHEAK